MEQVLATVALIDRNAHLRREAAAWAHLHPSIDPPDRLPVDLEREPLVRRLVARLSVRPVPRRTRRTTTVPASVVITASMTRG